MPLTPQRKVTTVRPIPSGRANASHFGGQEAQAIQGLGKDVQSAGIDLKKMSDRQDAYVAKNAYLDARKESLAFSNEKLQLTGENAFNSSFDMQTQILDIEKRATDGMSPRQKNLFIQNWKPAAIQDSERVALHQRKQIRFAEDLTNESLVDSAAMEFTTIGNEDSLIAMKAGLTSLSKSQGWPSEVFDEKWKVAHDHAVTSRISALSNSEDFEGAESLIEKYSEELGGTQTEHMRLELDRSRVRKDNRIASLASQQARTSQIDEQVFILDSNDPTAVPPLEKYAEWYGPQLGRIKHAERLVALQKLDEGVVTLDEQIEGLQAIQGASTLVEQIYTGNAELDDVYETVNLLAAEGSEASSIALAEIKGALTKTRNGKPASVDVESSRIFATTVRSFNDINQGKGVPFKVLGKEINGEVGTTPSGTINTSNDATSAFQTYWAGWEDYKAEALAAEGVQMTTKRLRELEVEYFSPLRQVESRKSFRNAVESYPAFQTTSGKGIFFDDAQSATDAAAAQLLEEITNPELAAQPKG